MTTRSDAATTSLRPTLAARRGRRRTAAVFIAVATCLPAASAQASAGSDAIWIECVNTGAVSTHHSLADFAAALQNVPSDAQEYTACIGQIKSAELAASRPPATTQPSGTTGTGGSGGSGGAGRAPVTSAIVPDGGKSVDAPALAAALQADGISASAPAGQATSAGSSGAGGIGDAISSAGQPASGQPLNLATTRAPAVGAALALPIPILTSVLALLMLALMPVTRAITGRRAQRRQD